jgi:carboxyl-terminal processing protease
MIHKALIILIPVTIVCVLGVTGANSQGNTFLSPLGEVYDYIKSYFYWPEQIDDQALMYGAIQGMVKQLEDPYSEFLDPEQYERFEDSLEGEFSGVGIEITIKENVLTVIAPIPGTPADLAGVRAGDIILEIDGESTEGISLTEASIKIRGEQGTEVILTVQHRDGTEEEICIIRGEIKVEAVTSKLVEEENVAYIRISRFDKGATLELDRALLSLPLEELDGVILDLRNNPGGRLDAATSVASRFVDEGLVVVSTKSRTSGDQSYYSTGNIIPNLPLAVLINEGTASAAEIAAGAIRDHQMGILIGQRSFGKGVIQHLIEFSDGSALKLTTGEYYTPSGQIVQEQGLNPDIELSEGDDPMEIAAAWIDKYAGMRMPIALRQ